jgi:Dehydrogenases with different specificities (related to short-chain alcohol dehydrogenases)
VDLGLRGRTAFVAASTAGLGRAIGESLGREGANVVITGRRLASAQEIAESLPSAIGVQLDVTDASSRAAAIATSEAAFGAVDILVLNGPGPRPSTADDLSTADLTAAFDQLVSPGHDFIMRTLPGMRARGWGRVLAVGSSGVVAPIPNLAASNLGRSALAGYLKTLANEVASEGITVNLLLPGRIATDRVARLDAAQASREGIDATEATRRSRSTIPVGRYGTPEEFGDAAAFLCSTRASYITGVALRCDGGLVRTH